MSVAAILFAPAQTGAGSPISTRTLIIVGLILVIGFIGILGYRARERSGSDEEEKIQRMDD